LDVKRSQNNCQVERMPIRSNRNFIDKRSLSFKDEKNSSESVSMLQSCSSVKSFCQLDLQINLSDDSNTDLKCYKILTSPEEVFKTSCFLQKKICNLYSTSHNGDAQKNRSFYGYKKISPKIQNGLFHPYARAQSCKLLRKSVDFEDSSDTNVETDFESKIEMNLEVATENSKKNVCSQEPKASRNGEGIILQFPDSLEPLINKRKALMMQRSLTSPNLHQETSENGADKSPGKCFKSKSWKCGSFKAAFGKKFSIQKKISNSPLSERKISFETLPIPPRSVDCNVKAKSDNDIFLKELPKQIQTQNFSDSRINVESQQASLADHVIEENRLKPAPSVGQSDGSSRDLVTSCDTNQPQPDENHQSKILYIIVAVFLICSLPRAILNLVEFEHMFSLYYLAYFVSEDDEVVLKARAIQANEEIACFYPPFWFVLFTNVSSLFMTLNASLGFFIYSFSCALFRAELYLRVQRFKNELRAKQVKIFNALHCRTEGSQV